MYYWQDTETRQQGSLEMKTVPDRWQDPIDIEKSA